MALAPGVKAPTTKPFLQKLYTMLEDESAHPILSWTPNGESIVVHQPEAFAQQLLPLYFKHNNFSSFVRQLNTYGFNKVDPDAWVFGHPDFKRGAKSSLHLIQRKSSHKPAATKTAVAGGREAVLTPFSPVGAHDPAAAIGDGTFDEAALQHELSLSRAEHAGIASRITELSNQLQMARQQQANTRGSIGKIMAFLSQVYHMRGGTSGQVAGPSSAADLFPGPPALPPRVMPPAVGQGGEEAADTGRVLGKRQRLAEVSVDGQPRPPDQGAGARASPTSSSLAEERLAGVPALQVENQCARLQELSSSEAAVAAPVAPPMDRQLSRGEAAAEALPPQFHEAALQLVASTELQDEAIDQIKNASGEDKPEPEPENLESFLWDFLEGAQAHADSSDGEAGPS